MSASAELVCVHPSQVPLVWPAVRALVLSAVLRTDLSHSSDIEDDVLSGKSQLWVAFVDGRIEAAAATLLRRTDRHLVCILTALGGANRAAWLPLLQRVEAWAKAEGAARFRIYGRKGWARVLRNYRVSNVVLERAL